MPSILTQDRLKAYNRDGFVIVRGMYDREEVDLPKVIAAESGDLHQPTSRKPDR